MKDIPPAEFVLEPGAKEDIAEAVVSLRNRDYSVQNRFLDLNYTAETVEGLFDSSTQVSVSGKHMSMPESDEITPEYRRAMDKLRKRDLRLNEVENVDVDVYFPFEFWQKELLADAREVLEDVGFKFEGFRLGGYAESEKSVEDLYGNFRDGEKFIELLVAEPTERGEPELEVSARYVDEHFEVEVYDWNYSGELETDEIRAYIERSLMDEGLPVRLGDLSDGYSQRAPEFFYG